MAEVPKAGTKIKETYYVHAVSYYENGVVLFCNDMSKSSPDYICLGAVEIEYTIPEHQDITQLKVNSLEQKIEKMNAEHFVKVENIKDQISRLLAIGYSPNNDHIINDDYLPF